ATSISNFWQRWHITMSSFFRDYLYNSLSSAWKAPVYVNLLIVFVAIGLWHGAGWNFVLYGCIHGSLVALEYYNRERRLRAGVVTQAYRGSALVLRICVVFSVISMTRLLFRGEDLTATMIYFSAMLSSGGAFPLSTSAILALITASLLHFTPIHWRDRFMDFASSRPAWMFSVAFVTVVYIMIALSPEHNGGFIYFQF
ncbi:MAG: MBOAT family protein, partial [Nitrosomonadales bacterium]